MLLLCSSPKHVYTNKENLYKKNNLELNASFVSYHINDSISQLFIKIPNENLIYKRPDTSVNFYAAVKIKYFLFDQGISKQLIDSGSITVFDRQRDVVINKNILGNLYMRAKYGKQYNAEAHIYDLNKKSKNAYVIHIDKSNRTNNQNFLLQKNSGEIAFGHYFNTGDTIVIKSFIHALNNHVVDYFLKEFPLSPPPFSPFERSVFNYKPDSFFIISARAGVLKLVIPPKGFYHITFDLETKNGLTLFSVESTFPGIKNETEMIRSTRYIMSKKEYEMCINSINKKQAIDDFWLDLGGSTERAKELLKKYYVRVTESNKLFTSFQPGWQTDRGMIYVIYGAPNNMYKYSGGETWIFGNESQPNAVRFNFKRIVNPFTDNDFILERSEFYKDTWYNAVDYWRQGHIYLDN